MGQFSLPRVMHSFSVVVKIKAFVHSVYICLIVIVCLLSLHGSGAGIVPRRVVGFNSFRRRRSVPVKRVRRETSAESWSVRSSSRN